MFDNLVRKFGAPEAARRPTHEQLAELEGRLPTGLLAFWQAYGIGLWLGGKFQFCLPERFWPVSSSIFANDPQLGPGETHIIGFSALGELLAWNERHQRVLVDLPRLAARVSKFNDGERGATRNYPIETALSRLDREGSFDVFEQTDAAEPLFERARQGLGPLALGECYGFVPALALGGPARLEHLERLDALVHFSLLADLGRCRLLIRPTPGGPETVSRMIGA